jgi:hypothetical protein
MRRPFILNTGKDSEGLARYSYTEYDGEHQLRVLSAFRLRVGSAAMGMRAGGSESTVRLSPRTYLSNQLALKVVCRSIGQDGMASRAERMVVGGNKALGVKQSRPDDRHGLTPNRLHQEAG